MVAALLVHTSNSSPSRYRGGASAQQPLLCNVLFPWQILIGIPEAERGVPAVLSLKAHEDQGNARWEVPRGSCPNVILIDLGQSAACRPGGMPRATARVRAQ